MKLSIIIILYNEFEQVQKTLQSVEKNRIEQMEILLVDNSSDKKGHKAVLQKFPKIRYVQNKKDLGFAGGVNVGIKNSRGEFFLILTPDMHLLPNTIKKTFDYIEKNDHVGLVGCRIYARPGSQEFSVVKNYPSLISQLYYYNMPLYKLTHRFFPQFNPLYVSMNEHKNIYEAKAVSGQYMLIRRKAIEDVGLFDSKFFLYFEDIDMCKRLNENNWKVVYLPVGGNIQGGLSDWKQEIRITQSISYYMKSLYVFFRKHYGLKYAVIAWFIATVSAIMSIPYLLAVLLIKKVFGLSSQAGDLLPIWVKIAKWHLIEGIKEIF